jgi:hypothetical protein
MKATEEPPDEKGHRRIWHHSDAGGDLVSVVDKTGRVVMQELYLFDDLMQWHHGARIRTGKAIEARTKVAAPTLNPASLDKATDRDLIERLRRAFEGYGGTDTYLLHAKRLIESSKASGFPASAVVTRAAGDLYRRSKSSGGVNKLVVIGLGAAALIGIALLVMSRSG